MSRIIKKVGMAVEYTIQTKGSRLTVTSSEVILEHGYWSEEKKGKETIPIANITAVEWKNGKLCLWHGSQTYSISYRPEEESEFAYAKQLIEQYIR